MWIYSSREDKLTSVFILSFYLSSSSNRLYNCPASRGESLSFSLCICLFTYLPIAYIIVYLCLRVHCACTYTCIHLSIMYLYTYVYAKALAGGPRKTTIECVQEVYILFPKNSIFFAHAIYMLNRKEILNCGLSPYELHFGCRRMNPKIVWPWEISLKCWLYRILMNHNNILSRWCLSKQQYSYCWLKDKKRDLIINNSG